MNNVIKYKGLEKLSVEEQATLKRIVDHEYVIVQRFLKKSMGMEVVVKTHHKLGKRKLYLIDVRVVAPMKVFRVQGSEADIKKSPYFDLAVACHKAMEKVKGEIERCVGERERKEVRVRRALKRGE